MTKRFYDAADSENKKNELKTFFDKFKTGGENILNYSDSDSGIFPKMEKMLETIKINDVKNGYFLYRILCELTHGQFFSYMQYDHNKYRVAHLAYWHLDKILSRLET